MDEAKIPGRKPTASGTLTADWVPEAVDLRLLQRWSLWWPLGIILLVVGASLWPGLGQRDVTRVMANVSIGSSQETWHAFAAMAEGTYPADLARPTWALPVWAGRVRVNKPPMLVWLNLAAATVTGHTPGNTSPQRFILICRLVAAALTLLAVASVYWIGLTVGDRKLAILAALVLASMLILARTGRTASYDTHLLGWATFAIAAGWAALRRPTFVERGLLTTGALWIAAGLATAAAVLTKGPLGGVVVVLPLALVTLTLPGRRVVGLAACAGLAAVGAAVLGAWYLAVADHAPALGAALTREYAAHRDEYQPVWYYVLVLVMVAPWSGYLVAGLLHPLVSAAGDVRRRRLGPVLWFLGLLIVFSIPGAKQQRYLLPALPAAALVCAILLRDHAWQAAHGRPDRGAWLLERPLGVLALLGSVLLPALLAGQGWLMDHGYLGDLKLALLSPMAAALLGAGLLLAAMMATRKFWISQPFDGAVWLSLWMLLVLALLEGAYAQRSQQDDTTPATAAALRELAGDGGRLIYFEAPLAVGEALPPAFDDEEPLLIHLQQAVPGRDVAWIAAHSPAVIVSAPTDAADAALSVLHYAPAFDFTGDKDQPRRAFVRHRE